MAIKTQSLESVISWNQVLRFEFFYVHENVMIKSWKYIYFYKYKIAEEKDNVCNCHTNAAPPDCWDVYDIWKQSKQ